MHPRVSAAKTEPGLNLPRYPPQECGMQYCRTQCFQGVSVVGVFSHTGPRHVYWRKRCKWLGSLCSDGDSEEKRPNLEPSATSTLGFPPTRAGFLVYFCAGVVSSTLTNPVQEISKLWMVFWTALSVPTHGCTQELSHKFSDQPPDLSSSERSENQACAGFSLIDVL